MVEISWNKKVLPFFFQNKKESQRGGMIWISWNKRFCLFSLHNWNQSENFHTKFATRNINSFQRIGWQFEEANPSIPWPAPKYILERKKVHTAALRKVLFHNMCCLPPLMWGKENVNRTIPSTTCGESKGPHTHTHTQIPRWMEALAKKKYWPCRSTRSMACIITTLWLLSYQVSKKKQYCYPFILYLPVASTPITQVWK